MRKPGFKLMKRDTDKTSTDKISNGQMIDVTKNDKTNHLKKDRQTSTNIDNYQLISVNEIIFLYAFRWIKWIFEVFYYKREVTKVY